MYNVFCSKFSNFTFSYLKKYRNIDILIIIEKRVGTNRFILNLLK
jgi:hypothetical protein